MFAYCGNNPIMFADPDGLYAVLNSRILMNAVECPSNKSPQLFNDEDRQIFEARKKYNSSTVNVYFEGLGSAQEGMINAEFYIADSTQGYINIHISPSLDVKSKYEMNAVLDVIMASDYYSESMFGTKEYMRAQWEAHNICFDIASSGPAGYTAMQILSGASNPIESSRALDIRCKGNVLKRQEILYQLLMLVD